MSRWTVLGVMALLVTHFVVAVASKRHESITSDELAHIVAGATYWELNDFRLQPENGNLPQRLEGLPYALTEPAARTLPKLDHDAFWKMSDVWAFGHEMLYETGVDHFPRVMMARAIMALFSVSVGLIVFLWARALFGTPGGFVSLVLYTFYPTILAHGALATSDICVVFFLLLFLAAWWRSLNGGGGWMLALSTVLFGLAFVAKYSAFLLLPVMGILLLVRCCVGQPLVLLGRKWEGFGGKFAAGALAGILHGLAAFAIIWASFGFRYSGFNPRVPAAEQYLDSFQVLNATNGIQGKVIACMADHKVLPESYLYGYIFVVYTTRERSAFLNGEYSTRGWHSFFPKAFAYKSTLPYLILLVVGGLGLATRWREKPGLWKDDLYRTAPLTLFTGVYLATAILGHLNIGERHLLPAYPGFLILAGACGVFFAAKTRSAAAMVCLLLLWHAGEAVAIYPHYLAYFNEAAGGPSNGWKHLADSSLDWGQDLPSLADWLNANTKNQDPVYLAYFGSGEPYYYHIHARELTMVNGFHLKQSAPSLEAGTYCISATILDQIYGPVRGPWTLEWERNYQNVKRLLPVLDPKPGDPPRPDLEKIGDPVQRQKLLKWFLGMRDARMCYYLRVRKPDAMVGYSILIYRLTAKEVHDATEGSLKEWSEAILARSAAD